MIGAEIAFKVGEPFRQEAMLERPRQIADLEQAIRGVRSMKSAGAPALLAWRYKYAAMARRSVAEVKAELPANWNALSGAAYLDFSH